MKFLKHLLLAAILATCASPAFALVQQYNSYGATYTINSSNGFVGIGTTTAPVAALDVTGSDRTTLVKLCNEGASIASSTTIAPTACIHHVTGTTPIVTITIPPGMTSAANGIGGCITLIADGIWTTTTAGNIQAVMTAVSGTPYQACYSPSVSKWFIK